MARPIRPTALADAGDVLSDPLRRKLEEIARALAPHRSVLERRFRAAGKVRGLDPRQRAALLAITPGTALTLLSGGLPVTGFFEQVEYNGRRLAKMHLPPGAVVSALERMDQEQARMIEKVAPGIAADLAYVRAQLLFCVVLTLNNAFYQVREAETRAFYDLFRVEVESRRLEELLERLLVTLAEFSTAVRARVYLLDEDAKVWTLGASIGRGGRTQPWKLANTPVLRRELSEPRCVLGAALRRAAPDPHWSGTGKTLWSVPLTGGGVTWGVLQFSFDKEYEWLPRERELLAAAAERCWLAIEKARLVEDLAAREEQVRQLAGHMLHVEEAERRRVSRELHDEAGQSLLCVRLRMEMLESAMPESMEAQRNGLREARETTERTILEIRRLIAALSPAVLEQLGLGAALRQTVNRFRQVHTAKVRLVLNRLGPVPKRIEMIVYRLVQECFNNIAKHSMANTVNLSLSTADGYLRLNVEDNGIGFDIEEAFAKRESFGLSGMRERVALLGGTFRIESTPGDPTPGRQDAALGGRTRKSSRRTTRGGGTRILIELPLPREAEAPYVRTHAR